MLYSQMPPLRWQLPCTSVTRVTHELSLDLSISTMIQPQKVVFKRTNQLEFSAEIAKTMPFACN